MGSSLQLIFSKPPYHRIACKNTFLHLDQYLKIRNIVVDFMGIIFTASFRFYFSASLFFFDRECSVQREESHPAYRGRSSTLYLNAYSPYHSDNSFQPAESRRYTWDDLYQLVFASDAKTPFGAKFAER